MYYTKWRPPRRYTSHQRHATLSSGPSPCYATPDLGPAPPARTRPAPTIHTAVSTKRDTLADLCHRFHVRRLEVFGSAACGVDFDAQRSDADLLVAFEPGAEPDFAGFFDLMDALEQVLGQPVDLADRQSIEQSRNYLRRRHILQEAEPIFVAG